MIGSIRLVGRHHIGDIAHHEELPRAGIENRFGCSAGVATGNDQRLGLLSVVGQDAISVPLTGITRGHEVAVTIEK